MTIGKKLYLGFGAILAIMLVLFFINMFTVRREYAAQDTAKTTQLTKTAISSARSQMMQDRSVSGQLLAERRSAGGRQDQQGR